MFKRTILIPLFISFSGVRVFASVEGLSCSDQSVGGVCVTMDNEHRSPDCHGINGFVVFDNGPDGEPAGYPGCGTASVVQPTLIIFKTNM